MPLQRNVLEREPCRRWGDRGIDEYRREEFMEAWEEEREVRDARTMDLRLGLATDRYGE